MTWRYDGPQGRDEAPSVLTVEFREEGAYATELTLTHARARDAAMRDRLAAGWTGCLDKLDGLFDKARRTA